MTTGALERIIRQSKRQEPSDRCGMCSAHIPEQHRHVLDEDRDKLLCACQACSLLFDREAAGRGHYQLVPTRRVRLDVQPGDLGVPVGLAFFVKQPDGTVVARYPSPLGTTHGIVDAMQWVRAEEISPELRSMTPLVEALLVNTARSAGEHWIVPISDCYRLVAVIRSEWKGLSGGGRVFPAVQEFFEGLVEGRRSG